MNPAKWTEIGELFADQQGPFAPESLYGETNTPDVFSRQWTDGSRKVTVSAAPCTIIAYDDATGEPYLDGFEIIMCTETCDADDEGGDTCDYDWDRDITYTLISEYAEARERALSLIKNLRPECDLDDPRGPERSADLGPDPADYPGAIDHLKD